MTPSPARRVTCVTSPSSSTRSSSAKPKAWTSQSAAAAQSSYETMGTTSAIELPREVPRVTFGIVRVVDALAVLLVPRLVRDLRSRGTRALAMGVDIIDVCVDEDGLVAAFALVRGLAEHDLAVAEPHLRVRYTIAVGRAERLLEAERTREEVDRGGGIVVQEIWIDRLHARQPKPPRSPCLGEKFRATDRSPRGSR